MPVEFLSDVEAAAYGRYSHYGSRGIVLLTILQSCNGSSQGRWSGPPPIAAHSRLLRALLQQGVRNRVRKHLRKWFPPRISAPKGATLRYSGHGGPFRPRERRPCASRSLGGPRTRRFGCRRGGWTRGLRLAAQGPLPRGPQELYRSVSHPSATRVSAVLASACSPAPRVSCALAWRFRCSFRAQNDRTSRSRADRS